MCAAVPAAPPAAASWVSEQAGSDAATSASQLLAVAETLDQAGIAKSAGMLGLSLDPLAVTAWPCQLALAAVVDLADAKVAAVASVD